MYPQYGCTVVYPAVEHLGTIQYYLLRVWSTEQSEHFAVLHP